MCKKSRSRIEMKIEVKIKPKKEKKMKKIMNVIKNVHHKVNYRVTSAYVSLLVLPVMPVLANAGQISSLTDLAGNIKLSLADIEGVFTPVLTLTGAVLIVSGLMKHKHAFSAGQQGGGQQSHGVGLGLIGVGALLVAAPWLLKALSMTLLGNTIDVSNFSVTA